jgi:hypothetical protein
MGVRRVYYNDVIRAMDEEGISDKFEEWADLYFPDAPNYFGVLVQLAFTRGLDNLYESIVNGEFEEELDSAPVF